MSQLRKLSPSELQKWTQAKNLIRLYSEHFLQHTNTLEAQSKYDAVVESLAHLHYIWAGP
jgi:hypothetical protein